MTPNANNAVAILEKIEASCGASALAYWVLPNVILTLSGARAYCDGIFWNDKQSVLAEWDKEITQSIAELRNITDVLAVSSGIESVRGNETYASFEIVLEKGLNYVLDHTKLLSQKPSLLGNDLAANAVAEELAVILKHEDRFKGYSDENIHHIAFGILVGYPDKAITESVLLWEKDDPFMEPLMDADIRGARYYTCPQPVYSYPRHLVNDIDIQANEKLWSQILSDYYHSNFHKTLEKDAAFLAKMEQLGGLR